MKNEYHLMPFRGKIQEQRYVKLNIKTSFKATHPSHKQEREVSVSIVWVLRVHHLRLR